MLKKYSKRKLVFIKNLKGGEGTISIHHSFMNDELSSKMRHCSTTIIPPGASIGLHKHEKEEEVYMIIEGQGILFDGFSEEIINEGDAILTKCGESHSIKNNGTKDIRLMAIIVCY